MIKPKEVERKSVIGSIYKINQKRIHNYIFFFLYCVVFVGFFFYRDIIFKFLPFTLTKFFLNGIFIIFTLKEFYDIFCEFIDRKKVVITLVSIEDSLFLKVSKKVLFVGNVDILYKIDPKQMEQKENKIFFFGKLDTIFRFSTGNERVSSSDSKLILNSKNTKILMREIKHFSSAKK